MVRHGAEQGSSLGAGESFGLLPDPRGTYGSLEPRRRLEPLEDLAGLALGISEVVLRSLGEHITAATIVLVALLLIFGSQFTLFAMWFDMESNKDLR